ncbi:MAG: hypothetical protein ACLRFH_00055, partial [Opitutales bacterium]
QETATTNNEVKEKPTIANEELKVQVIPDWDAFYERNGFVIQKGMDQYVIEYPIRLMYVSFLGDVNKNSKKELNRILAKLRPLHTDKAKKLGKKPIVFKYQHLESLDEVPIEETDEFSVESLHVSYCRDTDMFEKLYNLSIKNNKPIVFKEVPLDLKDEIEKNYDLANCKVNDYCTDIKSFDDYLKLKKLGIENLKINITAINYDSVPAKELRKQLYLYIRDKQVQGLLMRSNSDSEGIFEAKIPIEYSHYIRLNSRYFIRENGRLMPVFDSQDLEDTLFITTIDTTYIKNATCNTLFYVSPGRDDIGENVSCKTFIYQGVLMYDGRLLHINMGKFDFIKHLDKIRNLETIYLGVYSRDFDEIKKGKGFTKYSAESLEQFSKRLAKKNISLRFYDREKLNDYAQYINGQDIQPIVGYVNVKNKPEELSNEEWDQVLVLKQEFKELIKKIQSESIEVPKIEGTN